MPKKKKKRKIKKSFKNFLTFVCLLIVIFSFVNHQNVLKKAKKIEAAKILEKRENKKKYQKCYISEDISMNEELKGKIDELNSELKSYNAFVKYEDLTTNYTYGYKENEIAYGASLIKLVDAIYLLDNNVDLNKSKTYLERFRRDYSEEMDKETVGKKITLRKLMEYAISVSDNTAHLMLVDYIGENKLKEYGKSIGALHTLEGSDKYGNQTASDTSIYLKKAYELINDKEEGETLKNAMINNYKSYLPLDENMVVAHKYGSYDKYFHDIGIVYGDHDYTVSILTTSGKGNYEDVIKKVHGYINDFHQSYWKIRESYCQEKVYK